MWNTKVFKARVDKILDVGLFARVRDTDCPHVNIRSWIIHVNTPDTSVHGALLYRPRFCWAVRSPVLKVHQITLDVSIKFYVTSYWKYG